MRVTTGARAEFAASMIGLGILGFIYGDFALVWQPVPAWVPARQALACLSAAIELAGGLRSSPRNSSVRYFGDKH